jgi:AraC family transcriptional regulator
VNGTVKRLEQIPLNNPVKNLYNVNALMCYETLSEDAFPYMIGLVDFSGDSVVPNDLKTVEVNAYTWAIFRTENHSPNEMVDKIQGLWKRIFPEWFPNSGYEHADGPDMELYYNINDKLGYSEVWIPVVKK